MRIGFGFDVHRLEKNQDFWLGGILIPHEKGAVGHSDADVLIHAMCDALLGAANLGDIGFHFPDNSDEFKGVDSKILLKRSIRLVEESGYYINNIDTTICLQSPKINKFIDEMKRVLSDCMNIPVSNLSIKATTTEKLGFVGNEQGVSAYAVVLVSEIS